MPDRNPYGEPLLGAPHIDLPERVVHVTSPGYDPRQTVANTLRLVSQWGDVSYRQIADDVEQMQPTDIECGFCAEEECEPGCPMMRWRGQA